MRFFYIRNTFRSSRTYRYTHSYIGYIYLINFTVNPNYSIDFIDTQADAIAIVSHPNYDLYEEIVSGVLFLRINKESDLILDRTGRNEPSARADGLRDN